MHFHFPLSRDIAIVGEGKKTKELTNTSEGEEKDNKKTRKPEWGEKDINNT
jgi:hypothetical protein